MRRLPGRRGSVKGSSPGIDLEIECMVAGFKRTETTAFRFMNHPAIPIAMGPIPPGLPRRSMTKPWHLSNREQLSHRPA